MASHSATSTSTLLYTSSAFHKTYRLPSKLLPASADNLTHDRPSDCNISPFLCSLMDASLGTQRKLDDPLLLLDIFCSIYLPLHDLFSIRIATLTNEDAPPHLEPLCVNVLHQGMQPVVLPVLIHHYVIVDGRGHADLPARQQGPNKPRASTTDIHLGLATPILVCHNMIKKWVIGTPQFLHHASSPEVKNQDHKHPQGDCTVHSSGTQSTPCAPQCDRQGRWHTNPPSSAKARLPVCTRYGKQTAQRRDRTDTGHKPEEGHLLRQSFWDIPHNLIGNGLAHVAVLARLPATNSIPL